MANATQRNCTDIGEEILDLFDDWEQESQSASVSSYHFGEDAVTTWLEHEQVKPRTRWAYAEYCSRTRQPELLEKLDCFSPTNFPKLIYAIRSMVGDDETITSNSLMYNVLCVLIGPIASMIRISWADVGFHKDFYNYAEGWVLLPPSARSDFENVNRHYRNTGVPWVLDGVKFKNLSPVRKQSEMDRDLPSKFRNLAEAAAWTSPDWPTYDSHQVALLLGIEIFDFMRSKQYPFLFKAEGGCGGIPPWGNLYTAAGMIFRFRRGRASKGILGIMAESNAVMEGRLAPEEAFFTKNLHLAMSGDQRWFKIRAHLETLKANARELGEEYMPRVDQFAEEVIPPELLEKSALIHPQDVLTGVALSHLRDKGYIATELDVMMRLEDAKRLEAIWGPVPLCEINDQIELRKNEIKEAFIETIDVLSHLSHPNLQVQRAIERIRGPFSESSIGTMLTYYRMHAEQSNLINSFIYNERLRVFKAEDVDAHFRRGVSNLRDHFAENVKSDFRPDFRRTIMLADEREQWDHVEEWLGSKPLQDLLMGPIPHSVGPDDAKLVRDIIGNLTNRFGNPRTRRPRELAPYGALFLVITADRRLIQAIVRTVSHMFPGLETRVVGLKPIHYFRWCWSRKQRNYSSDPKLRFVSKQSIWSVVDKNYRQIDGPLYSAMAEEMNHLWGKEVKLFEVFYDLPNINRQLERYRTSPDGQSILEISNGFATKQSINSRKDLFIIPIEELKQMPEFRSGLVTGTEAIRSMRGRLIIQTTSHESVGREQMLPGSPLKFQTELG